MSRNLALTIVQKTTGETRVTQLTVRWKCGKRVAGYRQAKKNQGIE
jgi:hypothetical protein